MINDTREDDDDETYFTGQIADLRRANQYLYEELQTSKLATKLLDRLQEPRVLVLPSGQGVIVGGRQDGWLCWRHPDGQWVTLEKLQSERISTQIVPAPRSAPNHDPFSKLSIQDALKTSLKPTT